MAELTIAYRLPLPGWPRALFKSDYGLRGGRVVIGDQTVVQASTREALAQGVSALLPESGALLTLRAVESEPQLEADGRPAIREDRLRAPTSRSAWVHGWIALCGSLFGFIAGFLYVLRSRALGDPWAMKMALHMAVWHLLLTLTLFPSSVWGQRGGIRAVQGASLVFFAIHVGIALANLNGGEGPGIALFNAASAVAFLAAILYGQRAFADMDPLRALTASAAAFTSASAAAARSRCVFRRP